MPAVLILHVKRFLPNLSKGSYDKRSDRVKVETELKHQLRLQSGHESDPAVWTKRKTTGETSM